ncbi:MAG: glycosyltransferase family 4 protein [Myxococcota bacterium]|nr:glycosyltransferase family 4 protein [Myxococcota bacterium]
MRVLAITKIFPNAVEPLSAPFNRQQFAALAKRCHLEVMATVPWFPGAGLLSKWSSAGKLAQVPYREVIEGIEVSHPRTLFVPRLAHATWGPLYAASIAPALRGLRGKFDVVLGSWAYPDGFAAVIAARLLGLPCVVKLHGSDINIIAKIPGPRRLSAWALPQASKIVAVSRALADEVAALGVPRDKIAIVMNGVDASLFHPRDRAAARKELGLGDGPLALYVGNLKVEKGVLDLAAAWKDVPTGKASLVVIGGGPAQAELSQLVDDRVKLVGPQPLASIPTWMAACDVLVLPSHAEGTPNVVLEALACGRRVVATNVGGIPDLITTDTLGQLVPPRDPKSLAVALAHALATSYDPTKVADLGARGGWDASAAALHQVLSEAAGASVGGP